MQDRIFYSSCFGIILGVLFRSFVFVDIYLAIFIGTLTFVLIFFLHFILKNKWAVIGAVFALTFSLGVIRFDLAYNKIPGVFEAQAGKQVSFIGQIVEDPDVRETNQQLTVKTEIDGVEVKILVREDLEQDFEYGDEISFSGKLEKPENFLTDDGKMFDYLNYLQKDGIFYLINGAKTEIISRGNGNLVREVLFKIKNIFLNKINMAIPEPEGLLMGGLILGEKSNFSWEMRNNFVKTGTIHIIALSGYNVTIVAEWFMKFLKQISLVSLNGSMALGILMVWLFVLMTGGSTTAIRAGIMASLALFARATGRNYDVARALILAAVSMILINPFVLVYDVSFELSFIATIAVIFLAPKIEQYFMWVPKKFGLRDIVSVTCAAYIFVLPFILYKMGNLSFVALPANILILPFIPFTMLLGFLTGFIGLISHVLAVPIGYLSYLLLHYELGVINFFADIPFAAVSITDFPLLITLAVYAYFIYRLFGTDIKKFFTEPL